jgi:hypothetical protein
VLDCKLNKKGWFVLFGWLRLSWKKLGLFALGMFILLASSMFVLADCCTFQGTCTTSGSNCPSGYFVTGQSCSALAACQVGCCCSQNLAMRQGACSGTFVQNTALVSGSTCSCAATYSVAGTVLMNGQPVTDAVVSVGSLYTTTQSGANAGKFTLNNVPEGQSIVVTALSGSSTGNITIAPFSSNLNNVVINIAAGACTPGCNILDNSYCDSQKVRHPYDISVAAQKAEYCSYCADADTAVCGSFSECKAGDGACPMGCTSATDSDCSCNAAARNGYCPISCSASTDADCGLVSNPSCGDGLVSYPFETCEQNSFTGQLSLCDSSSCSSCNCLTQSKCGNGVIDAGESCELGNVCSDGSTCLNCQCGGSCTDARKAPSLTATYIKNLRQVQLSWAVSDFCDSLAVSFEVWECKKDSSNTCANRSTFSLAGSYPRTQKNVTRSVLEKSTYTYYVKARYSDSTSGASANSQVTTGDPICLDRPDSDTSEFCYDNKRSRCDANDNIATVEACGTQGKFCTGPNREGATECSASDVCRSCNGLYGMFARYLDLKVSSGSEVLFCNDGIGRSVVSGCYYDETKAIFSAFTSCSNIRSCYDYKSQEACTDPNDPCGRNSGCEWKSFESNPSLGGVCRPVNPQSQDCTLCENPTYNWLSPVCTPEACGLFGSCFYQGVGNSPICSSRQVSTCGSLTSSDQCEGASPNKASVSVNAVYSGSQRTGGTHTLSKSNDVKNLGKCYWDSVNSRCMRDADGLRANPAINVGFDCPTNDFACESDFASPVTTILNSQAGVYQAYPVIYYSVADGFAANKIRTFFCIARQGLPPCYPTEVGKASANDLVYVGSGINASGVYVLYYYSVDPAQNLEVVRNMTLVVDADAPFIELLSPRNLTDIALNSQNLNLQARTAIDASFVCANNTFSKVTTCINNCQKKGAGTPCIDSDGSFSMVINIAGNSTVGTSNLTRSIQFYAQDYAGNRYSNTLLGILYDITPPAAPTIIIS